MLLLLQYHDTSPPPESFFSLPASWLHRHLKGKRGGPTYRRPWRKDVRSYSDPQVEIGAGARSSFLLVGRHGIAAERRVAPVGEWIVPAHLGPEARQRLTIAAIQPVVIAVLSVQPAYVLLGGSSSSSYQEDWEVFTPLDRLTVFDVLDNLALPQRLERFQQKLSAQADKVRRQQERLKNSSINAKDRVVEEWRRRVPTPDERLERYGRKMREAVDRLGRKWNESTAVTTREKISFIAGVLNIFISGYLIGARPEWMYVWYTLQLLYFMPIRIHTYRRRGYHYFLADLCYFVNVLAMLSIWFFPRSKRLFMSTYCLAYGNNAAAILAWRNSLVFHSMDKVCVI